MEQVGKSVKTIPGGMKLVVPGVRVGFQRALAIDEHHVAVIFLQGLEQKWLRSGERLRTSTKGRLIPPPQDNPPLDTQRGACIPSRPRFTRNKAKMSSLYPNPNPCTTPCGHLLPSCGRGDGAPSKQLCASERCHATR
jgi:hypothetical protein